MGPLPHSTPLPRNNLLALATLLREARRIERDLAGRLSRHPKDKSLVKQQKEYQRLVGQLTLELERALARYLARLKSAAGSVLFTLAVSNDQIQSITWTSDNLREIRGYRPKTP